MLARTEFLARFQVVREVDVKGHFHPNELRRKLARDFTGFRLHVLEDNGGVQKGAVGQATGTAWGMLRAGAGQPINPAARVEYVDRRLWLTITVVGFLSLLLSASWGFGRKDAVAAWGFVLLAFVLVTLSWIFGKRLFHRAFHIAARVDTELQVEIGGETYEDFRTGTNVPISSNLTVLVGGKTNTVSVTDARHDRILRLKDTQVTWFDGVQTEYHFWRVRMQDIVNKFADKAGTTARELEESFAGRGDVSISGPPLHATIRPFDADPIDMLLTGAPDPTDSTEGRSIPPGLRWKVFERDSFTCRYCGRRAPEVRLEVDHGVAWAAGGETDINNLVTSCSDCNRGKSAVSVDPNTTKGYLLRKK